MEGFTLDSLFKQVCDKLDTHQFALAVHKECESVRFIRIHLHRMGEYHKEKTIAIAVRHISEQSV